MEWWIELFIALSMIAVGTDLAIKNYRRSHKTGNRNAIPLYKDNYEYLQCLKDYLATADRNLTVDDADVIDMYKNPVWFIGEIERVERKLVNDNIE